MEKIEFVVHGDSRGELIAIEQLHDIPFEIKRIYYMYNIPEGDSRGYHAHKITKQVLLCVYGSCKVFLDDGYNKKSVALDRPNIGLYVGPMVWHSMYDFSEGSVLLVVASEYYDEDDYIRSYSEFQKHIDYIEE